MQAPDGHFYYRDLGWRKVQTPMLHWGQGTMFKALAHLSGKLDPSGLRVGAILSGGNIGADRFAQLLAADEAPNTSPEEPG